MIWNLNTSLTLAMEPIDYMILWKKRAWIWTIRVFFSHQCNQNEDCNLPYLNNHNWTHTILLNPLQCPENDIQMLISFSWLFRYECQAMQHTVSKYQEKSIAFARRFSHRKWPAYSILQQGDKTWNKQRAHTKLIIKNGDNIPIAPYI